jgi:hypothetical protein
MPIESFILKNVHPANNLFFDHLAQIRVGCLCPFALVGSWCVCKL